MGMRVQLILTPDQAAAAHAAAKRRGERFPKFVARAIEGWAESVVDAHCPVPPEVVEVDAPVSRRYRDRINEAIPLATITLDEMATMCVLMEIDGDAREVAEYAHFDAAATVREVGR